MKKAVICFTRVPKPGFTKTRLLGLLTPQQCARLHWAFLRDLTQVYSLVSADLFIAHTPDPDWDELKCLFPAASGFFPQEGDDLGEKMHHALCQVFSMGYDMAILTGADLPLMTPGHLHSGFEALETAEITIGPTPDGGYYLIGMKQPHKEIFHVPSYGGATVFENTIAAIEAAGLSVCAALPCGDVDTAEDLRELYRQIHPDSATGRCLREFLKEGIIL